MNRRLAWVLLLAFAVRLVSFGGAWLSEGYEYVKRADDVRHARYRPRWYQPSDFRVGAILPIAAAQAGLGVNDLSSGVVPMIGSLALVALTFAVVRPRFGERAATLAALTAAVFPLGVLLSVAPMSDLPAAAMMGLTVWLALKGRPWAAGFAAGGAHLMRESAFFVLAVLALRALVVRDRGVFRTVFVYVAVVGLEAAVYAAWLGQPMARWTPAIAGMHHWNMAWEASQPGWILHRVVWHIPSMLFNPVGDYQWPYFGLTGPALVVAACFWRRMRFFAAWAAVLLLLIDFWPNRIWPYVPGSYAWARELAPLTIPFAAMIGVAADARWHRRWMRGLVAAFLAGQLALDLVSSAYFREWHDALDGTAPILRSRTDAPVYTDLISMKELSYRLEFERDVRSTHEVDDPPPPGALVVVNDLYEGYLRGIHSTRFHYRTPEPTWRLVYEKSHPTPLYGLRMRLMGAPPRMHASSHAVRIYEVPRDSTFP